VEADHAVTVLDVAHMELHPCVWQDEMPDIRDALLAADMVVFVTPVYYFGMSAQFKMVIDRFYSYTSRLSAKGLKSALIAAAWDSDEDVMPALTAHYQKLCRYMNFSDQGMVLAPAVALLP